jgi:hypothetical protein
MSASTAVSRMACSGLVGCLLVAASLVRGEMKEFQPACSPPQTVHSDVTARPGGYYIDQELYEIKLVFNPSTTYPNDYANFANQKAYVCYTKDTMAPIKWEYNDRHPVATSNNSYVLYVKAHKPTKATPTPQKKGGFGLGHAKVIVTDVQGNDLYTVGTYDTNADKDGLIIEEMP